MPAPTLLGHERRPSPRGRAGSRGAERLDLLVAGAVAEEHEPGVLVLADVVQPDARGSRGCRARRSPPGSWGGLPRASRAAPCRGPSSMRSGDRPSAWSPPRRRPRRPAGCRRSRARRRAARRLGRSPRGARERRSARVRRPWLPKSNLSCYVTAHDPHHPRPSPSRPLLVRARRREPLRRHLDRARRRPADPPPSQPGGGLVRARRRGALPAGRQQARDRPAGRRDPRRARHEALHRERHRPRRPPALPRPPRPASSRRSSRTARRPPARASSCAAASRAACAARAGRPAS